MVVDTSVAVKFYVPENGHEEAVGLLAAADSGAVELLAPGTILPEAFNAVFRQERRGMLDLGDALGAWEKLLRAPVYMYASEDLIERAAELYFEIGSSVYDGLFLALAEESGAVMVTDDGRLLKRLEGTDHARLAVPLSAARELV